MKAHRFFPAVLVLLGIHGVLARADTSTAQPATPKRTWQGIPGLERTPKGRLFISWFSGGTKEPAAENTVFLCRSDDQGKTFTEPAPMAGPTAAGRAFDPTLWRDPGGRLWYIFNRGNKVTAQHGVCARTCADPDAATPAWSKEFRVGYDEAPLSFRINKPTVLSTGQWIMPVTHAAEPIHDWFAGPTQLQGVGISADRGRTWTLHGALQAPHWALENMIVQLRDARLWMLIRTGSGFLWQSYSSDCGKTWTAATASSIANPGSRFFIRRLASGNLLLVNHYRFKGRDHIAARLSRDDGRTWNEGLLLDPRGGVSYPDGVEAEDGLIWIVYDHDRYGAGEILLARFREQDVVAGKNVSGQVRLQQVVNKLDKPARPAAAAHATIAPGDGSPKRAADAAVHLDRFFPQARDDSLLRRAAPLPAGAEPAPGVGCRRRASWVESLHALRLESTLINRASVASAPAAQALFRLVIPLDVVSERPGYALLKYSSQQWYGSTFWSGPDWTRVGKDWQHPGQFTPSIRCFQAPRDGRVTIAGRVCKLHRAGEGIRAAILLNKKELWSAEIEGSDGAGREHSLTADVRRGDCIRFVVDKRRTIRCGTTGWDPLVSYADGPAFQASQGFGPRQGAGPWHYEMRAGAVGPAEGVTVHGLRRDLTLVEQALAASQPIQLDEPDLLPLWWITEGRSRSGLLLAADAQQHGALSVSLNEEGLMELMLSTTAQAPFSAAAKASASMPDVYLAAFDGPWTAGLSLARQFVQGSGGPRTNVAGQLRAAYADSTSRLSRPPEIDLLLMAQAEWRRDDKIQETAVSYRTAAIDHLERARALLAERRAEQCEAFRAGETALLDELAGACRRESSLAGCRRLYLRTRLLKRQIVLGNPLLNFRELLVCKRLPPSYSHEVGQYFGWRQRPGGGLFVLCEAGYSLAARDLLGGRLAPGSFLAPRLSYDARRLLFSFVACRPAPHEAARYPVNEEGGDEAYYHIYEMGVDGSGLRQLTSGPYDDLMPEYLPDGGIVFCSSRRRSYSRCFGSQFSRRWHSFTLHRMDGDGRNLRILSVNDVSEWFPAVSNSGHLLFARWDYIDRDAVTHQNLWAMRPDGTNPVAVWGNASSRPHCEFQVRPIPGSDRLAFIASAHHAITGGPLCLLDTKVDSNSLAAVTRITPGPFPEAESTTIPEYYESPWPLSERYFLVAYSAERLRFEGEQQFNPNPDNALGIYLLDAAGNRELIYRDPSMSTASPAPLVSRPRPPVLPALPPGARDRGEMLVSDVYQGLGTVARGTIKQLRIVQIFPKTTPIANSPAIGLAGEENARAILGTVPVEADGSARFRVPALKPILFQALDGQGYAYQTMRSTTYVQPGETTSCVGCHEHRMSAPPVAAPPLALRHAAAEIEPGEWGGRPFSFVEVVQPVLDRHCIACHGREKTAGGVDLTGVPQQGFTRSYWTLCGIKFAGGRPIRGGNPAELWVPRFWMRNQIQLTPPGGGYGARGSRLMKLLCQGPDHYGVKLADGDVRRLAAWIDLNAVFYGAYAPADQAAQAQGKRIGMPEIQ